MGRAGALRGSDFLTTVGHATVDADAGVSAAASAQRASDLRDRQGWRWVEADGSRGSRGFADGPSLHLAGPSGLDFDEVYEGPDEVHPHHHSHHVHLEESFDMDEFAVAVLSYGSTILFATLGAALAMRLFREVLRPARSRDELPDVVQMDIPGVQPFRPCAGQGYHLQAGAVRAGGRGAMT